jgi:hypothetical protein
VGTGQAQEAVRPGIEVLLSDSLHLVAGRRVGLITNHTGIGRGESAGMDRPHRSVIDLLHEHPAVELAALYAPEHGIRGDEQDGVIIASEVDARTGIPIHSLYGTTRTPTADMLEGIDVLLFDMQDVGARYYTYVSTMALAMEAAGAHGVPFVVLDRPNPIRGDVVQGNVLDPDFATFVGMFPVPMRHGMTPGELARLYVGEFADRRRPARRAHGGVVARDDVRRDRAPVGPTLAQHAVARERARLSRDVPVRGHEPLRRTRHRARLPVDRRAVARRERAWPRRSRPTASTACASRRRRSRRGRRATASTTARRFPRYASSRCRPPTTPLAWRSRCSSRSGRALGDFGWLGTFDRLAGTDRLRVGVDAGLGLEELTAGWDTAVAAFEELRAPYLLYR